MSWAYWGCPNGTSNFQVTEYNADGSIDINGVTVNELGTGRGPVATYAYGDAGTHYLSVNAIENLVLADQRCNNDERDLLPAPRHVTAWARRNQRHGTALVSLATAGRWDTDAASTVAVARSIYSHLPPAGTPLWLGFKDVGNADPAAALAALA